MKINDTLPFRGALDGTLTTVLRTLDKNPMANAVGIDLFAMVGPRTYIDTKERNKYAGAETFFREFTGTLIVCLSASYFAKLISKVANHFIDSKNKINTKSWFSNESVAFLTEASKNTSSTKEYITNVINSLPQANVDEWADKDGWKNIKWNNQEYKNIHEKLKNKEDIISAITKLVDDKNISSRDKKKLFEILELRLVNLTQKDKIEAKIGDKTFSTSIHNLLRDTIDMGKDVLSKSKAEQEKLIAKILKINKVKSVGALAAASTLGLTNQYINRKITEKRTGTKGFVGSVDYKSQVEKKASAKDNSAGFWIKKILTSAGMAAMAIGVMRIKSPADFIKKLEFTGPVTSGNAIKTVYASTLIGRFLASDSSDELRETATRDYLGFLNWLVLGGFAAKATGNLLDSNRKNLFNESSNGKGVKHWLNEVSLKSHYEIAAKGKDFARRNMWKLNAAHIAGLAYSTITLGILLPKLNIWLTKNKQQKA